MSSPPSRNILIVTGELSGEIHAAHLVASFGKDFPFAFSAVGSQRLARMGVDIIFDYRAISATGVTEVLSKLVHIRKAFKTVREFLQQKKPALVILVDYPGFNLRIARFSKSLGIPVIYFIPPQIWAWRKNRVHTIKRYVDKVISILPFEKPLYDAVGVDVTYVGHPYGKTVAPSLSKDDFCAFLDIPREAPIVTIMPGSRENEIRKHLPILLDTIDIMRRKLPNLHVILPLAETVDTEVLKDFKERIVHISVVRNHTYDALSSSDLAIVASGSATLEAAVLRTPTIVIYRVSALSYAIAKMLVSVRWISLPNIIAGKEVFPEFIQDLSPARVAEKALSMVHNGREDITEDFDDIITKLGNFDSYSLSKNAVTAFLENRYGPIPETA